MQRQTQIHIFYFIAAVLAVVWLRDLWVASQHVEEISYSAFEQALKDGRVESVQVDGALLRGKYRKPTDKGAEQFVTPRVDIDLARELTEHNVEFRGVANSGLLRDVLSWVLPALAFFVIWMVLFRRMADREGLGGMMAIGKSKARVYVETDIKVTFEDVAGVDEAKTELREIVEFLKDPKRYGRLGARAPKGVLLVGPPGTGKTLLARAVAGEAGVPFFSINGSEFVELFVGVGAARVRDLFDQARQRAPAIIFIDELDALGRVRGVPGIGGHDEKEQTLNQLLAELDGFDPRGGLVLLAATNRPEILDPALLRAGRFDRQVLVDRPDKAGRIAILGVHMPKVHTAPDADPEQIAALTAGFSGADLANLVNEAALLATRRNADAVGARDFTEAIERIVAGLEKRNRRLSEPERRIVAYHEMGHALVALSQRGGDPVHKVSIIPRGIGSLGYTIQRPTEDRFLMTQQELENKLTVLLAGRAAEKLVFGALSTGAADDLAKATEIARSMVTRYGMDPTLGQATYTTEHPTFLGMPVAPTSETYSDETIAAIDAAVRQIVAAAFERAVALLTRYRAVLDTGAARLLDRETLDQADLEELRAALQLPAAEQPVAAGRSA
ncbi:MAG TPA: ATP-dependent zinc metalloprotease FtsH [Gammaproteobacteria bacterium]|jgi:cell division protease FtsH|nr:ATP-dependent zinc metalloprotease FtsH [Gammaproteobacteria bacterium]